MRLAKVITNMPLVSDQPISFGVTEFCEVCGKCAEDCPGELFPTAIAPSSPSTFRTVRAFATRLLIGANNQTIDQAMLKLDDASGFEEQMSPREYWKKSRFVHIK